MRIEHIALYVNDLESAKAFFTTYLGGHANEGYHNRHTQFRSYFLEFDGGARLELMHKPGLTEQGNKDDRYGYAHIAFSVGSRERVNELTRELIMAGYPTVSSPRITGDGYYESCITDLEGNLIEITV